jgi:PAS domain S-box-containing protein
MNLDSQFQNLLTSGITLSDPETLRKFKAANSFQLAFIMVAPFLGLLYFYIGALPLFYVTIGSGLLMISSLILLRATKNLVLASHFAVLIVWISLLSISWYTGAVSYEGVLGPAFMLNAGLILLAIFLLGYSGGTVWTTVVFLESGLMIYLHRSGFQFPDLIPPEISTVYSLGTYLVALLCILLFAFLFEKEKGEILSQNREKAEANGERMGRQGILGGVDETCGPPVFKVDAQAKITYWSEACERAYQYPSSEMIGRNIFTLVSKNYRPLFKETMEAALEGKSVTGRPFKYVLREGEPVYVITEAYPVKGSQGDVDECLVINTDITELRLKMKKLELYAAETKEKLKSMTEEYELLKKKNIASFIRKKDDN